MARSEHGHITEYQTMSTDAAISRASTAFQPPIVTPRLELNHQPLTNPRAYYRSKVLSVSSGVNSLVCAAATLLTTLAYLRDVSYEIDTRELYQELSHEIRAFETQAQSLGYRSEIILVTRYILCTALDEIILSTTWGEKSTWSKHKLLNFFHGEDWGGERLFLILDRLGADVAPHIDVLELIYLCLSLGYKGKFANAEEDKSQLDHIVDELYQNIRWHRGDIKKDLFLLEETLNPSKIYNPQDNLPFWMLAVFTLIIISTLYVIFNFTLGTNTSMLYQQLEHFLQNYG